MKTILLAILTLFPAATAVAQIDFARIQELYNVGKQQFLDEKYEDSVASFLELIKLLPESERRPRSHSHYYIACGYSRLGKTKDAVEHLDKAMELGLRDLEFVARDPDLDPIRKSKAYAEVIEKYHKIEEERLQKFDFDLVTVDGEKIAKKDFIGKVLIVDVWGTWCGPCRMGIPHFVALKKKYEKDGLRIVGINKERTRTEEAAKRLVKQFMKQYNMNYPCALATNEVLQSIPDLTGFPTTLFIGRDGRVRKKVVGYHSQQKLEAIIKPLLAEKAPKTEKTETASK